MNSDAMPATTIDHGAESTPPERGRQIVGALAYVVLMFCTGFAVAVALGSIVLLLSTPAQAADDMQFGLIAQDADGRRRSLPLVDTDIRIQVSGPIAHARIEQHFENPSDRWFEAIYLFPLPDDAAVSRMRMRVGERIIEAEIQPREQAARTYQQAKAAGQRAALLEQQRPNMFTSRVANIGPHERIVVELEIRQQIEYRAIDGVGHQRLRLPLVVGPRYLPAGVLPPGEDRDLAAPVAMPHRRHSLATPGSAAFPAPASNRVAARRQRRRPGDVPVPRHPPCGTRPRRGWSPGAPGGRPCAGATRRRCTGSR